MGSGPAADVNDDRLPRAGDDYIRRLEIQMRQPLRMKVLQSVRNVDCLAAPRPLLLWCLCICIRRRLYLTHFCCQKSLFQATVGVVL